MAKFLDLEGLNYFWEKIKSWVLERFAYKSDLTQKLDKLRSGQNIKTINGLDIIGSGNVVLSANDVDAVPTGRTINGKALSSNITLNASDVNALPSSTPIPTKVSDLNNDLNFTSVSIDRKVSTGTNIADITIDGTTTLLYAPQGGSEGEENIIEIVKVNGTALIPDSNKAVDISVPNVPNWALQESKPTYDYSEIGNTPTIPTVPTNVSAFNNDAGYLTSHQDISGKENTSNKVTSFQSTPDDMHYPSEKLVKDSLDVKQDIIDSSHKLSADYIQDGTTNKVINVKPDWNAASGADAEILNKPTIPTAGIPSGGNASQVLKKVSSTDYDVTWANQSETLPSAYCTTSGSTAAKRANCSLYVTQANLYLQVLIGSANTYQGELTLNINSAGAKPIYINGTVSSSTNYTLPNGTYFVFYDGTNYYFRTDGKIQGPGGTLEVTANKVISFQSTPDNTHYPSEKLVKDSLDTKIDNTDVEALTAIDVDNTPTANSTNLVTSGGVYNVLINKLDKMPISSASGTTLSAISNTYHNFASEVNTLAITLPAVTDVTHITNIVFMLTTGTTPAITFAASGTGVNVIAQDGFSIEASTTYEINAIFNGTMWVVAAMKLSTTPINS